MDAFWTAPPVTRTIVAATVVTSICIYGNLLSFASIAFLPDYLYAKLSPQLWRLATPFWLTGPKFSMLMDPVFLWRYGTNLETQSPRFERKGDFFVYIVFVKAFILLLSGVVLGNYIFMDALLLALAYTFAQENPNDRQQFFVVTFTARYLPYVMLALTFVMTGGDMSRVYNQATGLLAAHAYEFLTRLWPTFGGGTNWIAKITPNAVHGFFGEGATGSSSTVRNVGFGTIYRNTSGAAASAQPATARTSGFSSTWSGRGAGRRLGGE